MTINPRIIAGEYKGVSLKVPDSARPITSRVKAVMFDTLREYISNSMVLDLFAGSGNIGIEALSRGASFVVFVDHNHESTEAIRDNLLKVRAEAKSSVHKMDYKVYLKRTSDKFDLIFIDPPFDFIDSVNLRLLPTILNKDGIIVLKTEDTSKIKLPIELKVSYEKIIGENKLFFITHN